jgi:predicted membrane-bound dolichyl-phosphate-mannose-protein mannosyltransferase
VSEVALDNQVKYSASAEFSTFELEVIELAKKREKLVVANVRMQTLVYLIPEQMHLERHVRIVERINPVLCRP